MITGNHTRGLFSTIVLGMDFEDCSERALLTAAQLARSKPGAKLLVVHAFAFPLYGIPGIDAYSEPNLATPVELAARSAMSECVERLCAQGVSASGMLGLGPACELILRVAGELDADLIVVGTHGRRGLKRLVLGSVAERVVRLARAPVLTVSSTYDNCSSSVATNSSTLTGFVK